MKNILTYKGYIGTVAYSTEDEIFYGKLEGMKDLISFEGESVKELKSDFITAIDDYLNLCKNIGKEPEKTYKGTFNVRIKPDLHKKAYLQAVKNNISLNTLVEKAISKYIDKNS